MKPNRWNERKEISFNLIQTSYEKFIFIHDYHNQSCQNFKAGNCNDHQQVTMADSKPILLLQIGDMKLMKYTNGGMVLYRVKKYSGETVAEDLDREQLAARFPEMAQNLEG